MANVLATFAQFERRIIAQRTADALGELRAQGRPYSPDPFGFIREGDRLVPDDAEQRVLVTISRKRAQGKSYAVIAKSLNRTGTPAKRGGAWHAMSVRNVHLRAPRIGRPTAEAIS